MLARFFQSIHGGMRMRRSLCLVLLGALALAGCSSEFFTGEKKARKPPLEYGIQSPYSGTTTFAIAPAINLSGSRDFDVLVVSDLLFEEMQQVPGLNVLPVNKTLIAMQRLGLRSIDSPKDAQELARLLGADGLVVPAVTAYDPYNPPKVGMILQLYSPAGSALTAIPEETTTPVVLSNPNRPTIAPDPMPPVAKADRQPLTQVEAVLNSTNQSVLRELRVFAEGRTQYDSALLDQKFLMDSDSYMRFACHAMVRRLLEVERQRLSDR
jgi:hypothetical protein